jgi:hypothetical protein
MNVEIDSHDRNLKGSRIRVCLPVGRELGVQGYYLGTGHASPLNLHMLIYPRSGDIR